MPAGTPLLRATLSQLYALEWMELAASPGTDSWVRVDQLLDRGWWSSTIMRYCGYVQTPKRSVGAACSLQHYSGRWVKTPITVWLMTGMLLDLAPTSWWVLVDNNGATRKVAYTGSDLVAAGADLAEVTSAIVGQVDVMVDHVQEIGEITRDRALSGVAASVAGTWCRLWDNASAQDRPLVKELAEKMLRDSAWGSKPLLDFVEMADTRSLNFRRRHCCLIRLGKDHGMCKQCPRRDEVEPLPQIGEDLIPDFSIANIVRALA